MAHFSECTLILNLKRLLFVYGLWPGPTTHFSYHIYSYSLHAIISFAYCLFQTINLCMSVNDVDRFTESVYSTLTLIAYAFKLINYMYYQNRIIECLAKLMRMQRNSRTNENIFRAKLESLNRLTVIFFFVANCTVLGAALKSLLSKNRVLPVASWYPLDWKNNSRDFWIAFSHNILGAFIVGQINLGMDSYAYYLMAMVTAQFQMLHVHFEKLGVNVNQTPQSQALRESNLSLTLCLKELQTILELVADIDRYFSLQFFAQICLSGAVLGCGVYQLNTVSPMENFFQFTYLLAFMMTVMLQTFLYTYYGHGVVEASDALSTAVYSSEWYQLLPDLGMHLIILMERLKRRCEILAGKLFPMNLALFGKILDLSYRLYSTLL